MPFQKKQPAPERLPQPAMTPAAFDDAVERAVAERMVPIEAQIAALTAAVKTGSAPAAVNAVAPVAGMEALNELFSMMALKIADMSYQGSPERKPVDPMIMDARQKARERMVKLIDLCRAKGIKPVYRLKTQVYIGDALVNPYERNPGTKELTPQDIAFDGVPNEGMVPMDPDAEEIFEAFKASIGTTESRAPRNDIDPGWVTLGGLILKSATAQTRNRVPTEVEEKPEPDLRDEYETRRRNGDWRPPADPTRKEVRVLGTIAPPAIQSAMPAGVR